MTDNRILAFFPDVVQELNQEILHHPVLQELLNNHPVNEMEIRMAQIAAYCEIVLDGYYTGEMLVQLAGILVKKLKEKRNAIEVISVFDFDPTDVNNPIKH